MTGKKLGGKTQIIFIALSAQHKTLVESGISLNSNIYIEKCYVTDRRAHLAREARQAR